MKRNSVTIDMSKALPLAWKMQWQLRLKMYASKDGRNRDCRYVTAVDIENQVRELASAQLAGKSWEEAELAWGRPMNGVRITGLRTTLLDACRDWLFSEVRAGRLHGHNFGRGHISGMRFRPVGVPVSEAEKRSTKAREERFSKPRVVHARERYAFSSPLLCMPGAQRSRFGRRRLPRTTDKREEVTCPRCLKRLAESKTPVRVYFAPKIELVDGPNGRKTLGGDVDKMAEVLRDKFDLARSAARELLSRACERIEQAIDDEEELKRVSMHDIVAYAGDIRYEEAK